MDQRRNQFEYLLHQHLDWVYSSARRRVRDAALADDVAQATFILLWQQFPRLPADHRLTAWLYRTLRYCAANALRLQQIRQRHEREAAMSRLQTDTHSSTLPTDLADLLEPALDRLGAADRTALLLRFYRNFSVAEVGTTLGISEEAAKKRLQRALDRLRKLLASRGLPTTTTALGTTLLVHATDPAPAKLTTSILTTVAAPAANSSAGAIASRTAEAIYWGKAKIAATALLTIGLTGGALLAQKGSTPAKPSPVAATAPATLPATRPTLPPDLAAALSHIPQQFQTVNLEWKQTRTLHLAPDQATKQLGMDPYRIQFWSTGEADRLSSDNGLTYLWRRLDQAIPAAAPMMNVQETAFDGQVFASGLPDTKPFAMLVLYSAARLAGDDPISRRIESGYLDAAGIMLPSQMADLIARRKPISHILQLLERDGELLDVRSATLDGQSCRLVRILAPNEKREESRRVDIRSYEQRLRQGGVSEQVFQREIAAIQGMYDLPEKWVHHFYLDPDHAYALRRHEVRYEDGRLLSTTDCTDLQPFGQTWLPRKCIIQTYWYPPDHYFDQPLLTQALTLSSATLDRPAPTTFRLTYTTPGTRITDYTGPQPQTRIVPK